MEIRKITEKERVAVFKLHQYAYGFWSDQEVKDENLVPIQPDETFGAFEDGELCSALSSLNLQQTLRGTWKGMGGISMVGSYPEARRKGYVHSLMQAAFKEMKKKGLSVTMLLPFRETFYARLGYVSANHQLRLKAPLEALNSPSDSILGKEWKFERIPAIDGKDSYLKFIREFALKNIHGFAIPANYTEADWKRRNKEVHLVLVTRKGKIEALTRYRQKGYMHFEERGKIIIHEMHWRSVKAQAALFNYLGKHKDQIIEIEMNIPFDACFHHWFTDLPNNLELKAWNPWMVRVIDTETALEGLPADHAGNFNIRVADPLCKWNNKTLAVESSDGQIKAKQTKESPSLEATIEGVSALVYGTHSLEALEYKGWITILDKQVTQLLQNWFPLIPIFNAYSF